MTQIQKNNSQAINWISYGISYAIHYIVSSLTDIVKQSLNGQITVGH